jgi:hypothetical protein
MVFLLPLIPAAVAAITAGQVAIGGTVLVGGIVAGKALHDSGRRQGRKEGAEALLQDLERRGCKPGEE